MTEMITEIVVYGFIFMIISILYKNNGKVKKYKDLFFEAYVYKFNIGVKLIISIVDFIITVFLVLQLRTIYMPKILHKLCYSLLIIQLSISFLAIFWKKSKGEDK